MQVQETGAVGAKRIAVVGAGIAGLASAWLLQKRGYNVTLYEAGNYLGGHSNTVDVRLEGWTYPVDTGFLVFNDKTYPNLVAMFAELGVQSVSTDMSFGVSLDDGKLEWAGTDLMSVFAQKRNLLSPRFLSMLRDILRFNRDAERNLDECSRRSTSLGDLLLQQKYGNAFRDWYLLPMAAAIWSSAPADILTFPAATFLRFCLNHCLLQVNNRPQWRTVAGGSREYVHRIAIELNDVRRCSSVREIHRTARGVMVVSGPDAESYDDVILATHAPTSLRLLHNPDTDEKRILGAVRYQRNVAVLHTDISLLPQRRNVWSAWNYLGGREVDGQRPVCVSYLINQLQPLPFKTPVVVTLNPIHPPATEHLLGTFEYEHPVLDGPAVRAQQELDQIQGRGGVWHAGAWTGYGFHEDGLKSALRVAAAFDALPAWATLEEPPLSEIMAAVQAEVERAA